MGLMALAAEPDWYFANLDTMPRLPTNKLFYLEQKAGLCPKPTDDGESLNVRLVGKWGGGPSWGVTGKDTLVYLSRGSEVVVINFADTANPEILNYIQAKRLAGRPVLVDTLLYLATSGYIEVFNVKDPTDAPRVGRLATPVSDIDVEDTLLYSISADTFRVFDFADPANPHVVGACADSGYALDYDGGYAYLRDRWGMYILDVRNPTNPHRVASWGTDVAGVKVRGNHCYAAQGSAGSGNLYVLNVSNPASPWQEGVLSGVTCEGIYLVDTLLFTPEFYVVNIADSSRPTLVAQEPAGGGEAWVHPSLRWGVTAGWTGGLRVLNLSDIENPMLDTTMLGMFAAADISVKNGIACIASQQNYMVLLDVSNPAQPRDVGRYTAGGGMESVLNAGTIAYAPAYAHSHDTVLHAVDITDPENPSLVGSVGGWEGPRAMALRDSFLYAAEPYRFEVFNVANPRQPVWMGRCDLSTWRGGLTIQDSLIYVAPNIQIINVARPDHPTLVSSTSCSAWDIAVRDSIAYIAHSRESLKAYSVANPHSPQWLNSTWVPGQARAVTLRDSYAYLGCDDFRVFDIADPVSPVLTGQYSAPYLVMSLDSDSQYVYGACYLAGVCVFERLPVGITEPRRENGRQMLPPVRLSPNPVYRRGQLEFGVTGKASELSVLDALGRTVLSPVVAAATGGKEEIDFKSLKPGVYFLRCRTGRVDALVKFVKL
jgi:hypothetical protein